MTQAPLALAEVDGLALPVLSREDLSSPATVSCLAGLLEQGRGSAT